MGDDWHWAAGSQGRDAAGNVAPPASITVANALHGPREWFRIGSDGKGCIRWRSVCVVCGGDFEILARSASSNFSTTTCPAHRMTPREKAQLRGSHSKGHADRLAAFEAIKARKLREG